MKELRIFLFAMLVLLAGACSSDKKANESAVDPSTGKKKQEGKFQPYERFLYPTGELQMAGKLTKGKRNGPWSSWFKNGNQNSEATFVNDKMHGLYQVWYENGKVRIIGQYEMDKEIGTWYFFLENGDTAQVVNFDSLKTK